MSVAVSRVHAASLAGLALLGACGSPRPAGPALWTLFDVAELYANGASGEEAIAVGAGLPGGVPIKALLSDAATMTVSPTWADGHNAAYVLTEAWAWFDEIWAQPAYVPVLGWAEGAPRPLTTPWQPVFGVGPRSAFYSPFWETFYVEVPEGTAPESLTSARQIFDRGYPLHPAEGRAIVLRPAAATLGSLVIGDATIPVGGVDFGQGWLDGQPISFVDFPAANVRWNEKKVVEETPVYLFAYRRSDGRIAPLPIPTVAGTGPPYSNTPAPITQKPDGTSGTRYAGYWRVYLVTLPPEARVFSPPIRPDLVDALRSVGEIPIVEQYADPSITNATESDARPVAGLVAMSPECFNGALDELDPQDDPSPCRWLDSQAHIEQYLPPGAIERTALSVTCPLVSFRSQPVSR